MTGHIELEGLEAWDIKNEWNEENIAKYNAAPDLRKSLNTHLQAEGPKALDGAYQRDGGSVTPNGVTKHNLERRTWSFGFFNIRHTTLEK